ncbi:MAG: HIT domain-containing protein [Candidatus Marsarchaeota archaeon]|jgi:hypothetical protein|nr:HIT domain-containing protein [Candidatus Marsarchaeota archaeon]
MDEAKPCPLCNLHKEGERIYYEDDKVIIVDANNKKGHRERILVVWKKHVAKISDEEEAYTIEKLKAVAKKVFEYTTKYEVFVDKYSTIMEHWHRPASDIDPNSEDYKQILDTPRECYLINGTLLEKYI